MGAGDVICVAGVCRRASRSLSEKGGRKCARTASWIATVGAGVGRGGTRRGEGIATVEKCAASALFRRSFLLLSLSVSIFYPSIGFVLLSVWLSPHLSITFVVRAWCFVSCHVAVDYGPRDPAVRGLVCSGCVNLTHVNRYV